MSKHYNLIVLGGGPAGIIAARFAKRRRKEWRVALIRDQERSVIPCALPYALDGTIKVDDYKKSDEKLLNSAGIVLFIAHVSKIIPQESKLVSDEGEEFFYDYLIFTAGSYPLIPPLEGINLKNVFTVKDHPDIVAIMDVLGGAKQATVIGAGFIGLELAVAFHNRGLRVNVVEKESSCLANNLSSDLGMLANEELKKHGVSLFMKQKAEKLSGKDKVERVLLADGTSIPSDIVVFSVGVRPNVKLAEEAGIEVGYYGIKTDGYMRTSIKNIYAIGDCVESRDFLTRRPTSSFLATTAAVQAKVAAINVKGGERTLDGVISPAITRVFDLSFGSVGRTKEKAEAEGLDIIWADSDVLTREKAFKGAQPLKTRLIVQKKDLVLIGAEVVAGECIAYIINMLALAILNRNTAEDLAQLQYAGHPPQVDVPSRMHIVLAAEEILRKAGRL